MGMLDGKVAIITGASSGIGEGTAIKFVAEGARVVLASRTRQTGEAVADRLGENATFVQCDVASTSDLENMIEHCLSKWSKIDCLFNNAGEGAPVFTLEDITEEIIDAQFSTLVKSVMMATKLVAPHLKENGGCIINNASMGGHGGMYAPMVYSAAKAAVINFTQWSALDLAASGVRVNSISPGPIHTPIFHRAFGISDEVGAAKSDEIGVALGNNIPIGKVGTVEDIAALVAFLASDDSRFITGQDTIIDGGILSGWNQETMFELYGSVMDVLGVPRP